MATINTLQCSQLDPNVFAVLPGGILTIKNLPSTNLNHGIARIDLATDNFVRTQHTDELGGITTSNLGLGNGISKDASNNIQAKISTDVNNQVVFGADNGLFIPSKLKCDNNVFNATTDRIPQIDQTLTTTYGVGTGGTGQCLFRQDVQFDATNNSFEFNSVNGPSIATGSLSMSNATNQALGARALALGGTGGIVGVNTTNSGALSVSGTSLTGTGTLFGALFSNAGSITGTSNRKTLLGTSNCSIQGTGSDNHIAYSSLITMNTTGSLNTAIGCFTGTWLNGAKESGMWGAQAANINTTNARVNIWGGDSNTATGNARNAGAQNGEGLIVNTVDQMVHGSYNIAANNTTLSNSGSVANYTRVHGNGNATTRHVASAESSRGEYFLQSNGAPGDTYTTTINTGVTMSQPFTGQLMSKLFVNYNSTTSQYELWFGTPNGNILVASV